MKLRLQKIAICLTIVLLFSSIQKSEAFSLLGPVQPWMQSSNVVVYPDDIGGPMNISNGYRWNVPVVTYGFDKSFLDYFGTNGVAAVEGAIQILNSLPPASQVGLINYPFSSQQVNYAAHSQSLNDLKSTTLSRLLEQLGLAKPTRNIYVLRQWNPAFVPIWPNSFSMAEDWYPWAYPDFISQLNFDPQTAIPTPYVNSSLYSAYLVPGDQNFIVPVVVDPLATFPAVADFNLAMGVIYTGLTYDDVGGLSYLLSTNNINYENLLPNVVGAGTNLTLFVKGAWRPGVDKITFIPQLMDLQSNAFLTMTNYFTDLYITNGILKHQQLARVISRPDFLFSAAVDTFRTGTTNWINNADQNNNLSGGGPGIIQPPIVIAFQKLAGFFYSTYPDSGHGPTWSEDSAQDLTSSAGRFGTFDGSTNAVIDYPITQTGDVAMTVRVRLSHANYANDFANFEWSLTSQAGTRYSLQTSTNMLTWNTLFEATNNNGLFIYRNVNANSSSRFYRLIPQ